ncbi:MAG: hypothetical protein CMP10_17350 [Zetaproteobacteria bacterium]|nr:hypothetical protein [Pseudobdellovibrionaceae bacterium]
MVNSLNTKHIRPFRIIIPLFLAMIATQYGCGSDSASSAFDNEKPVNPDDYFVVERSIEINRPINVVFNYAGNPSFDIHWRNEVNEMTADGPWAVGTNYYEDSTILFNPHYLTVTKLEVLDPPFRMVVQTPPGHLHLRAERTFKVIDDDTTMFTYQLQVDKRMPRKASSMPGSGMVAKPYYYQVMKFYQWRLKRTLESQ